MNNRDVVLLGICLEDSLFAALYGGLSGLADKWQMSSPVDMWVKALELRRGLAGSTRPDLLLPALLAGENTHEAVVLEALVMYMLFNENRGSDKSPLRDVLARMLGAHGEAWKVVYEEFRRSEGENEQCGYRVCPADYANSAVLARVGAHESTQDGGLAHEMVSCALETHDPQLCHALFLILSRVDYQKGHIYEEEVRRLTAQTNEMSRAVHQPHRIENNFYKDSCRFEAGSTQNGDVIGRLERKE